MKRNFRYNKKNEILIYAPLLLMLMLSTSVTLAQVKFITRVDQDVVGRNQPIQVQFVVENAKTVSSFSPPQFDHFHLIQGPIQSSGMSIINGNVIQSKSLVFLLQPQTTGRFIIRGATALIDGKRMRSNNISVEVTNNSQPQTSAPAPFNFSFPGDRAEAEREFYIRPGEDPIDKIKHNLFVKVEVSKTSCYVNEPIVATYKLYSRLRSESRVVKRPSYNGFSVYDMVDPDGSVTSREMLNGKEYNVHLIRQSQLFPLQAGKYTLDPVEVENQVTFIKTSGEEPNSFDEIFNPEGDEVEETLNLSSKPVTITVKPLPAETQPPTFDGAVGNFKVTTDLSKDTVHAGEVTSLTVTVTGKGNLPIINVPALKFPNGIEGYDPKTNEDFHPESVPLRGTKSFKFPISAKRKGDYIIPPIEFSFFDPSSKSYKTDSTIPLSLHVLTALPGQKLRTAASNLLNSGNNISRWGLAALSVALLLVIALLGMIFYRRSKKNRKEEQEAILAAEKEKALAKPDPLDRVRWLMKNGNQLSFLKEMEKVTWRKAAETLSIPLALLNQPKVIQELNGRGEAETANLFSELVNSCETFLYIPGTYSEDLRHLMTKAELLFSKLDQVKS